MNLEKQNKSDDDIKKNKFTANNRYFTICIYTMFVIFFGAIIINLITSWNTTLKNIEKGLAVLMPFIIGALIAYILNPAVARFYKLFRDKCLQHRYQWKNNHFGILLLCNIQLRKLFR